MSAPHPDTVIRMAGVGVRRGDTELLAELDMIIRVPGGVLVRPLLARFRNAVVSVRPATEPAGLFDLGS